MSADPTLHSGVAIIADTVDDAGETVKAEITNARVITEGGAEFGPLEITTAQATGIINALLTSTTNMSGLTIRIDNTTGDEDDRWLNFSVSLSQAYTEYVCFDFETLDTGTATEGTDYLKRPTVMEWLRTGVTQKTVSVRINDDSVNDSGETVKVKISNTRLCDDASKTVTIAKAQATGTITNSDPMPQAWLSRFGRTVAEHSLDAIGERLRSAPGRRVTLGGQNLAFGEDSPLAGSRPGAKPASLLTGNGDLAPADALLRSFGDDARKDGENSPEAGHETSVAALLLASSFHLASAENPGTGSRWSFWSRGTRTGFEGARDALTLDGDVTTATVGLDVEGELWLLGVALSRSKGEGSFQEGGTCQGVCAGEIESTLTGVYPYVRYRVSEALSLWGALGHGRGELTLTQNEGRPVDADMEMTMAAGGMRGVLFPASRAGDFELAVRSDLLVVSTSSEAVTNLNESEAETSRLRLLLEGSREVALGGGVLTPSVEVGLRYDAGDAETGVGIEVGGALRYASSSLTIEIRGGGARNARGARLRGVGREQLGAPRSGRAGPWVLHAAGLRLGGRLGRCGTSVGAAGGGSGGIRPRRAPRGRGGLRARRDARPADALYGRGGLREQ